MAAMLGILKDHSALVQPRSNPCACSYTHNAMKTQSIWFWVDGEWMVTDANNRPVKTTCLCNFWKAVRAEYGEDITTVELVEAPHSTCFSSAKHRKTLVFTEGARITQAIENMLTYGSVGVRMV